MNMVSDLRQAFKDAELLARRITEAEQGHVIVLPKSGSVPLRRFEGLHCFDPWFIARVEANSHRRATRSLSREGFEVYYPAGRLLRPLPKRYLGTGRRKSPQIYLQQDVRTPYGDYVFLRYLFGHWPLDRLFDLDGVAGVCMVGERPAMVHDYEVEMLRLAEHDGKYDRCEAKISAKQLALAHIRPTDAARERWKDRTVTASILDESRRTIHFVEEFGRITCVIDA